MNLPWRSPAAWIPEAGFVVPRGFRDKSRARGLYEAEFPRSLACVEESAGRRRRAMRTWQAIALAVVLGLSVSPGAWAQSWRQDPDDPGPHGRAEPILHRQDDGNRDDHDRDRDRDRDHDRDRGRDRDRDRDHRWWHRDRDWDRDDGYRYRGYYGNGYYGNGGYYGYSPYYGYGRSYGNQAFQIGYQDGIRDGERDFQTGHSFRPTQQPNFRHADRGYGSFGYGSLGQYKAEYRQGYEQGYQRGYGRGGYGRRW